MSMYMRTLVYDDEALVLGELNGRVFNNYKGPLNERDREIIQKAYLKQKNQKITSMYEAFELMHRQDGTSEGKKDFD